MERPISGEGGAGVSEAFKTADPFPVGDGGVESFQFDSRRVQVVVYYGPAERVQCALPSWSRPAASRRVPGMNGKP